MMTQMREEDARPLVSFIIPLLDEALTIGDLRDQIAAEMARLAVERYEIVFVDDGSTDGSSELLDRLHGEDARVSVIHFRRNFGKAAAIDAGFSHSRGRIIFTMDADLQDDPGEIGHFLARLDEGYDLVNGWKRVRHDPITKTLPSKLFNMTLSSISGLALHDFNCGFKAYRREAASAIDVYGELHRYIPILVHWKGFRVTEIEVRHHPRRFGRSKYGIERILRGFFDCLTIILLTRYESRPLHLFGNVGVMMGAFGGALLSYLTAVWFLGGSIGQRPLLILGVLLVLVGVQLVSAGLVAEMLTRQNNQLRKNYMIGSVRSAGEAAPERRGLLPQEVRSRLAGVIQQESAAPAEAAKVVPEVSAQVSGS